MPNPCDILGVIHGSTPDVLAVRDRARDAMAVAWVLPDPAGADLLATALQSVQHHALARIAGLGEVGGRLALLTDPIPPRTLREQVLAHGLWPQSAGIQLALRMADALASLHAVGLVHGAVGPDAVYVEGPHAVLADLRKARFDPDPRADLTGLVEVLECALGTVPKELSELAARCQGGEGAFASAKEARAALLDAADALGPSDTWPSIPPPDRMTPPPVFFEREGDVVGSYVLQQLLGEGSMGRVFAARHLRVGRKVALKLLRPEHAASREIVQRFFLEARTITQIANPHIVQVFDYAEEVLADGRPRAYCVMELLDGQSLTEVIRKGPLPLDRVARIVGQLCRGLAAAHRAGVVHRDIKPDNLFLTARDGQEFVKLVDFGVAKMAKPADELNMHRTSHGAIIGTPSYMSPEQAAGLEVDHRADLHAVGVVLYELLAGRVPYTATRFGALAAQIIAEPPPKLPEQTASGEPLPPALAELVEQLLAKDPRSRPESAEVVERALLNAVARPRPRRQLLMRVLGLGGALAVALVAVGHRRPPQVAPVRPVSAALAPAPAAAPPIKLVARPPVLTATLSCTPTPPRPEQASAPVQPRPRRARHKVIDPFAE